MSTATELVTEPTTAPTPRPPRWRGVVSVTAIVLSALLALLAVDAVWLRNFVFENDRFVEVMAPLAAQPDVQDAVINAVTKAFDEQIDIDAALKDRLPTTLDFLGAPVESGIRNVVVEQTTTFVRSPAFVTLWTEVTRRAHASMQAALTGEGGPIDVTDSGDVTLDLAPVITNIATRLESAGLGFLPLDRLATRHTEIVLFSSPGLVQVQRFLRILDRTATALPIAVFVLWAVALVAGIDRRKTVIRIAIGLTVAMSIHLLLLAFGRSIYLSAITKTLPEAAAAAVFDLVLRLPRASSRSLIVLALLVMAAAILAGPSAGARRVRQMFGSATGRAGAGVGRHTPLGSFGSWVAANLRSVRMAVGALAVLVLISADRPTTRTIVWVAIGVVVLLGLAQVVAGAAGPALSPGSDVPVAADELPAEAGT